PGDGSPRPAESRTGARGHRRPAATAGEEAGMSSVARSITRQEIDAACGGIKLPRPPAGIHDVGDGDFDAIGREFLWNLVHHAGLQPGHRVLDIGCGVGRLAIPLTAFLDPVRGSYVGFDVAAGAIRWCQDEIASRYGNFSFRAVDLR